MKGEICGILQKSPLIGDALLIRGICVEGIIGRKK